MQAASYTLAELEPDSPVPFLTRWKVTGEHALVAKIRLEKGCLVKSHRHPSEQFSVMLSGRLRWSLGEEGTPDHRELILMPGQILHIPANTYHAVTEVLEDAEVFDILSPVGPMGVDSQESE